MEVWESRLYGGKPRALRDIGRFVPEWLSRDRLLASQILPAVRDTTVSSEPNQKGREFLA